MALSGDEKSPTANSESGEIKTEVASARKVANLSSFLKVPKKIKFNGNNTSKFLRQFELATAGLPDKERCNQLALFLPSREQRTLAKKSAWKKGEWEGVKEAMLDEFHDEERNKFTISDMVRASKKAGEKKIKTVKALISYHRKFVEITSALKKRNAISWQDESLTFLEGLPKSLVSTWEEGRRRRRLDEGYLAATAAKSAAEGVREVLEGGQETIDTTSQAKDDDIAPLIRRELRKNSANRSVVARLDEIVQDMTQILEDKEFFSIAVTTRRRHGHHSRSSHSSKSSAPSSSSDSSSSSSSSSSSAESSSDESTVSSNPRMTEKRTKGKKESKKGGEGQELGKDELQYLNQAFGALANELKAQIGAKSAFHA